MSNIFIIFNFKLLTHSHCRFFIEVSSKDRQLQAIAEGLAASVLHSSTSSNTDLNARDLSHHEDIGDGDVRNNQIDIQHKDKIQVTLLAHSLLLSSLP